MSELYISVDIESDGPIPGMYSMLSFGAAAFILNGSMIGTYSANLETLPGAKQDPDTMQWWSTQKEAWDAHRKNTKKPEKAMPDFVSWVKHLKKRHNASPVFVGYPAGFDFTFMYYYMRAFAGESPFSFSALDIKSYAMAKLGTEFRKTAKRNMPRHWFSKTKRHNHIALDDAIEQGELFINILKHK